MLELTFIRFLAHIFTIFLAIIGAVTGIWGVISCFVDIKNAHKVVLSKKSAIKLLVGIVCIVTMLVLISDLGQERDPQMPSTVSLSYRELDLSVNDSILLFVSVLYPDGKIGDSASWTSSDSSIVEVNSYGRISAKSEGTAQIIAQVDIDDKPHYASCFVTVTDHPAIPTGYTIQLSKNQAILGETFRLQVIPYDDDITQIQVYTISPSGIQDSFPLSDSGNYLIDTEMGTWRIYAAVTNKVGTYMAQKPEDFVEIEINSVMDLITGIIPEPM